MHPRWERWWQWGGWHSWAPGSWTTSSTRSTPLPWIAAWRGSGRSSSSTSRGRSGSSGDTGIQRVLSNIKFIFFKLNKQRTQRRRNPAWTNWKAAFASAEAQTPKVRLTRTFKASIPNNLSFQMRLRRPCQWMERMRGRRRRPISATLRSAVMFFFEMKMWQIWNMFILGIWHYHLSFI